MRYRFGSVDFGSKDASPPFLYAATQRSTERLPWGQTFATSNELHLLPYDGEYPPQTLFLHVFSHGYAHCSILRETAICGGRIQIIDKIR